jgi:hypothetical protein
MSKKSIHLSGIRQNKIELSDNSQFETSNAVLLLLQVAQTLNASTASFSVSQKILRVAMVAISEYFD